MTEKIEWNHGWEFMERGLEDCEKAPFLEEKDYPLQEVTLPHDWMIYDTKNLYRDSMGWYQKKFDYEKDGKRWVVRFEAVYMDATIYLNGKEIYTWKYGYSTFDVDLTRYLKEGENLIGVRVIHQAPNSRWYSGAGIYRKVWLYKMPQTSLVLDGTYITPFKREKHWDVEIDTEIQVGDQPIDQVIQILFSPDGKEVSRCVDAVEVTKGKEEELLEMHQCLKIETPMLWEIGKGNLYRVETALLYQNEIIDLGSQKIGFRTIQLDSEKGFFLNGKQVKIKGSCEHHGFGCLGGVANRSALRYKLETLREMGVNAIRTAHNMPSTDLMELADEMGFLVDTEAFDMWGRAKTTYDYARFFQEWMPKDVKSWVRRDRNHPSLIMWSLGNEIYDMHAGEEGYLELEALIRETRKHDPKGHGKITFASNYMRWENAQKCAPLVDAVGYNYGEYLYEEHHEKHPEWVIYGSETASMLGSRGVYHFPLSQDILCEDDEQCSALGNCFAGWGAHSYLDNILWDRDAKYSMGQFIWTGFDYFGEPTPYQTKNSYFGQVDTAGFVKDSFYIYQAEWTDYKENPMVHVFPHWDFCEGQVVDVCICSNAPCVELFVNGRSLGKRELDHVHGTDLVPHWSVPFEKGEIKAVAFDENGNEIATKTRKSFGNVETLRLKTRKTIGSNDPEELIFVEINGLDGQGNLVENANNRVAIQVTGAGRLIGIDNGDSTDFDQVKGTSKRLFQGKLLAVIAPTGEQGGILISATSPDILGDEIEVSVEASSEKKGVIANKTYPVVAGGVGAKTVDALEIPIRKLRLQLEGTHKQNEAGFFILDADTPEVLISCGMEPEGASYQDITWKVVNDTGIEVMLAEITPCEKGVRLRANGNGAFRLRAVAANGGSVASVRTDLCFLAEGLGNATMNPYEKIKGGLTADRPKGLSEGVEHGVRFLGKQETYIRFEHLDFGKYGSEEITLELFKYPVEPITFQIFVDDGERELLCEGSFTQAQGWMEFKEQTYRFARKLCGIHTIGIQSSCDFQVKTICATPIYHGLEKIRAVDHDEIFGDSYEIKAGNVEKIGNNVTLHFRDLILGNTTATRLVVCGKSKLENNSIHVKIEHAGGEELELIEFAGSESFVERSFSIAPITGTADLRFVFLPGSQFDLAWFQLLPEIS